MIIALDYDKTYTAAPELWKAFIATAEAMGHEVVIVTKRRPDEKVNVMGLYTFYTSRAGKRDHLREVHNINPDVWIDDQPDDILYESIV